MVDYSKWDNFAYNESDEESEDDDRPTVTRLEDGAKVKIGPKGATAMNPSGRFTDFAAPNQDSTPSGSGLSTSFPPSSSTTSSVSTAAAVPPAIKKDERGLNITNGASAGVYSWSQTRYEVTIQAILPATTKATEIRFVVKERYLEVLLKNEPYFGGDLAYHIVVDKEDNISGGIVWELKDYSNEARLLEFTLIKRSPIEGSILWWQFVYPSDRSIDTSKIAGRNQKINKLKEDWDKAHAQFKEHVKNIVPTEIDVSDEVSHDIDALGPLKDENGNEYEYEDEDNDKDASEPKSFFDANVHGEDTRHLEELARRTHSHYFTNSIEKAMGKTKSK